MNNNEIQDNYAFTTSSHKLILAEKPSVCRDISRVLNANEEVKTKALTWYKNEKYIVSSFLGHLVTLAEPETYKPEWGKPWKLDNLPIFPDTWQFVPGIDNKGQNYSYRIKALEKLMNDKEVSELICATDSGREGELIFRYLYDFVGCKKPYKRLWISSLTDESIINGFNNLLPGNQKEKLYQAGFARSRADWLVGMNLTRLYSIYFGKIYSIGRVQTPTVNMIVQRDLEIVNFKKQKYYTLSLENGAEYYSTVQDGENIFFEKEKAEKIKKICLNKSAKIIKANTKEKSENRPLLFSLTSLQKEANERHGFSAARTLTTMQDLYDKKLLTYPRTDSNYITEDMKESVSDIVKRLIFFAEIQVLKLIEQGLNLDNRIVDNTKISDHHAIIPTKDIEKMNTLDLNPDEKVILTMVINRFLLTLDKQYIYNESEYLFEVEGYQFKLKTKSPVFMGFKEFLSNNENEDINNPCYELNDEYFLKEIFINEKETSPPKPFTESTLLSAMENIDKRIEDDEKKKFVKERGLGTPATRASIIENILKRGYVERKNKSIISTESGRSYISNLTDNVKSVQLTADMEELLSGIENGKIEPEKAIKEIKSFINSVITIEKGKEHIQQINNKKCNVLGKCKKCNGDIIEFTKAFACLNNKECGFIIWKDDKFWKVCKKELTADIMKELLEKEKVLLKGLYSETTQKKYDAYVLIDEWIGNDKKIRFSFTTAFGNCPKCGGFVKEYKNSFSCQNSKNCGFTIWKNDKFWQERNKELTVDIILRLLEKKKVLVKNLYSSKSDKIYEAYILLDEWTGNDGKSRVSFKMEFPKNKE